MFLWSFIKLLKPNKMYFFAKLTLSSPPLLYISKTVRIHTQDHFLETYVAFTVFELLST